MRAVLVLGVMAYHYTIRWTPPDLPVDLYGYAGTFSRHWAIGGFGVHVFFLISGYVITMSVLRSGSAARFALSRFLRIYPAYAIAAMLAFLVPLLVGPAALRSSTVDLVTTLFLVPIELGHKYTDGAFWTLTVEAKFYFFVFLAFAALRERFWLLLAAIGWLGPISSGLHRGFADKVLITDYIGFFLIGMAAWYAMNERRMVPTAILLASGAVAYLGAFNSIAYDGRVSLPAHALIALGIAGLFFLARYNPRLDVPILGFLAAISYELYLVHQVLGVSLIGHFTRFGLPDPAAMALSSVLVVLAATVLQRHLAPPLRKLIQHVLGAIGLNKPRYPLAHSIHAPPQS